MPPRTAFLAPVASLLHNAWSSASPVRMRRTRSRLVMKILPSPTFPVFAAALFPATLLLPSAALYAQPGEVKSHNLANGMKVLVQEDHNVPNVAMYFFYRIGSRNEWPGITGLSHFFSRVQPNLEMVLADPAGPVLVDFVKTGNVGTAGMSFCECAHFKAVFNEVM